MASALIRQRPKPAFPAADDDASDAEENRVVLHDVPWKIYCALRDNAANNGVRMTYDEGSLELVSPSYRHERGSRTLHYFIRVWTEELGMPLGCGGATTFKLPGRKKGLEADECFYFANEALVRNLKVIDLSISPAPDLAVEIELSSPSSSKLPIYQLVKVGEIWLLRNGKIRVMLLGPDGQYTESDESRCLPGFPLREAERLLEQGKVRDDNTVGRLFRELVRELLAQRRANDIVPAAEAAGAPSDEANDAKTSEDRPKRAKTTRLGGRKKRKS